MWANPSAPSILVCYLSFCLLKSKLFLISTRQSSSSDDETRWDEQQRRRGGEEHDKPSNFSQTESFMFKSLPFDSRLIRWLKDSEESFFGNNCKRMLELDDDDDDGEGRRRTFERSENQSFIVFSTCLKIYLTRNFRVVVITHERNSQNYRIIVAIILQSWKEKRRRFTFRSVPETN